MRYKLGSTLDFTLDFPWEIWVHKDPDQSVKLTEDEASKLRKVIFDATEEAKKFSHLPHCSDCGTAGNIPCDMCDRSPIEILIGT